MGLSKKAIFFTITAFVFLAILFVILSITLRDDRINTGLSSAAIMESTRARFDEHYAPLVLRYTAYNTLAVLAKDSAANNRDLILPDDFSEAIMNGSYRTHPVTLQTLPVAFSAFANATNDASIANLSITVQSASIQQIGTFYARATATINYTLTSPDRLITYNRTLTITSDFSLVGILDAYYARHSVGTPAEENRVFTTFARKAWNTTEIERLAHEHAYIADPTSAAIFERLQGDIASSSYGVTSLIPANITPADNLTSVDVEYFNATNISCRYRSTNLTFSYGEAVIWNVTGTVLVGGAGCPAAPS